MKFDYLRIPIPERSPYFGNSIVKPIIPIEIKFGEESARYQALIDSGADFCIFDAPIGEYLGIDVKSGIKENFGGIQDRGGATAYLHEVTLNIGGWDYRTTVGFSYDIAKHGFGVLGQKGFFELFQLKFDYRNEEIEIKQRN
ncbi:MAG: hypothetical protein WAP74_03885 [Patescibacteria group bacterium]